MDDTFISFTAIAVLLAANGFFVAAEFGLVKARGVRMDTLAAGGSASGALVVRIQRDLEQYLAACQLGITMASLGLGWVGEPAVAALIEPLLIELGIGAHVHTISFLVGFLIFSSLHIVVGEQVPKTLAIRRPEPVSMACAYPLHAFYIICYPLNWLLNRASNATLALLGVSPAGHEDVLTSQELSSLVDVSHTHGSLPEAQASMVKNVFQFDERPVSRVMVPRREVQILDLSDSSEDNMRLIREARHSRLPVIENGWDNVLGVVLVKDILGLMLDGKPNPWDRLRSILRAPLIVPESQRVSRLFDSMRSKRAHLAFVLDEYGEFVGLVSLEDLLEEIVGEIEDEFDVPDEAMAVVESDGGWTSHGLVPLADLERAIGLHVDLNLDANTLSGLVMRRLERLPQVGDSITESDFVIEVESVKHMRVEVARIKRAVASDEPPPVNDNEAST